MTLRECQKQDRAKVAVKSGRMERRQPGLLEVVAAGLERFLGAARP